MENTEYLKRILLNMNYDSKNTLSENVERVLLKETHSLSVLTGGGNNGPEPGEKYTLDKYTLKHKDKNFVLIDTTINGFSMTLKYVCGEQSLTIQASPNNQFTGTILNGDPLEKELNLKYCLVKTDDDKADDTFWKRNDDPSGYWTALYRNLKGNGFAFKLLDKSGKETSDPKKATQMYYGMFIINRNLAKHTFIHWGSPATVFANLSVKYKGDSNINDVILKIIRGGGGVITLTDFLRKDWKAETPKKDSEPVIDYTKKGGGGTGNNNTSNKTGNGSPVSSGWNTTCKGTYSMGCNTPEVGQAQQCLKDANLYPYKVDNKFGKLTRDAVKSKIGKSSFTDADLQTICKAKEGSGGNDFDRDMGVVSDEKEKEDTTWTGNVY